MPVPGENIYAWKTTAADNGDADPLIDWKEGMPRAAVNNSARSMLAAHAKYRDLRNGSKVTGGTPNAQTFTSGYAFTLPIPTGLRVLLKIGPGLTNTAAATLNMDDTGDIAVKNRLGQDTSPGLMPADSYAEFLFNGTNWILWLSPPTGSTLIIVQPPVIIEPDDTPTPNEVIFTNLTDEFKVYTADITNLLPIDFNDFLVMQFSQDNGATWIAEDYNQLVMIHTTADGTGYPLMVSQPLWPEINLTTVMDVDPNYPWATHLRLYGIGTPALASCSWESNGFHATVGGTSIANGTGNNYLNFGINAIRFSLNSGTGIPGGGFASGRFTLYGGG